MNWEHGISHCHKTLPGLTGEDIFDMLDTAVKIPPAFLFHELLGCPIGVIFVEFMQN